MKNKALLFDYNNLLMRHVFAGHCKEGSEIDYQTLGYGIFKSIYASLYTIKNINEIILAVDDKSWRKIVYPIYKENRTRDDSVLDWSALFAFSNKLVEDFKNNLPFKVIQVKSAEADDIIGVLCRHIDKEFVIVSSDKDYKQCITSDGRVSMWDPLKKAYIKCNDPRRFVIESALKGQKKDNILNVLTPLTWNKEESRRPPFGPKKAAKIIDEIGLDKWLDKEGVRERFNQNMQVMDLSQTPEIIKDRILDLYKNQFTLPDPDNIINYITASGWTAIIDDFSRVEQKLLTLY